MGDLGGSLSELGPAEVKWARPGRSFKLPLCRSWITGSTAENPELSWTALAAAIAQTRIDPIKKGRYLIMVSKRLFGVFLLPRSGRRN